MKEILIRKFIEQAFLEDMPYGDITTDNLIDQDHKSDAYLIAKENGILAGYNMFKEVFLFNDSKIVFKDHKKDGDCLNKGEIIAHISGYTRTILRCERLALNILQRMSGIATLTSQYVNLVAPYETRIVDTRKTTPNFRLFEKEAVRLGGGFNHRYNLSDSVILKDNHITAAGGITEAVTKMRNLLPHTTKIEVEVENIAMLKEALAVKADLIMLDNMSLEMMKEAVELTNKQAILEASGNMNLDCVADVASIGIDMISVGALTHSYSSLDISLRFKI